MKIAPVVLLSLVLMGMVLADPLFLFDDMFRQQRALMRIWARSQQHTAEALMGGVSGGGGDKGGHHSSDSEHRGKFHHGRHHGKKHHKKSKKGRRHHKFMRLHNVLARLHRRGQTRRMQRLRDWGKWFG
nr:uncharacterized protein LOC109422693 [Aedes albopictus]